MTKTAPEQRQYLRFPPQEWEIALIQCSDAATDETQFQPEIAGLVKEESRGGCGLVVLDRQIENQLAVGDRCQIKIGKLGIVRAELKWVHAIDEGVSRIGLEFVE
ncbi:hypothetical protein AY599_07265 [Leptolyngbya valderiana BDU 20041]|nr:hypothetical protein AY599_07265 [Leptolyngbya valderiana BDU 20041]